MPSVSPVHEKAQHNAPGLGGESDAPANKCGTRTGSRLVVASVVGIYLLACGILLILSLARTEWHLVYPLDDAYIHMAIAKNLAGHGVWGVTRYEFTSCSSSPLWIILLSGLYRIFGVNEWIPLLLNLLFGALVLVVAHHWLARSISKRASTAVTVLALCFLIPVPVLALSGMEHTLHVLLLILFSGTAMRLLEDRHQNSLLLWAIALALLVLMVMTRFESLFVAGIFCMLLGFQRRWKWASVSVAAAASPVIIGSLISLSRGWLWLPNSLLLKGAMPRFSSLSGIVGFLGYRSLNQLFATPPLTAMVAAIVGMYIWGLRQGRDFWNRSQVMLLFAGAAIFIHAQFAGTSLWNTPWYLYRYEAYLVAFGIFAIGAAGWAPASRSSIQHSSRLLYYGVCTLGLFLLAFPLLQRMAVMMIYFPGAAQNVWEQQYQMARFLRTYYDGRSVAANDIGAINYFADLRCLDLFGLANNEIGRRKLDGTYNTATIMREAAKESPEVAIVYDAWFQGSPLFGKPSPKLPPGWTRVGQWRVPKNVALGDDVVSFYSVRPDEVSPLKAHLRAFRDRLPAAVIQSGEYLDNNQAK